MAQLVEKREAFPSDVAAKVEMARTYKDSGNEFFKQQNYKKARINYSTAIAFTKGLPGRKLGIDGPGAMAANSIKESDKISEELENEVVDLEVILHTNITTCYLKLNQSLKALESIKLALALKPTAWKSLLRKAEALIMIQDFEKADDILDQAYENAPDDSSRITVNKTKSKVMTAKKQANAQQKKAFSKIFNN